MLGDQKQIQRQGIHAAPLEMTVTDQTVIHPAEPVGNARACECLEKDKEVLFAFYDFPAKHWIHIRTTNPIESTFATVRHRHRQSKGCGSRLAMLTMVYKLGREAEKRWHKIRGCVLLPKVIAGVKFVDGVEEQAA